MALIAAIVGGAFKFIMTDIVMVAVNSAAGAFGTSVGQALFNGLHASGNHTLATQLQTNPQPTTVTAAHAALVNYCQANPAYLQHLDTTLHAQSPTDWQFAHANLNIDWSVYLFNQWSAQYFAWHASELLRKHPNLSAKQITYERTRYCPVDGAYTAVRYFRKMSDPAWQGYEEEVKINSWFWGVDPDPYDDKLKKGDIAQCDQSHRWLVFDT